MRNKKLIRRVFILALIIGLGYAIYGAFDTMNELELKTSFVAPDEYLNIFPKKNSDSLNHISTHENNAMSPTSFFRYKGYNLTVHNIRGRFQTIKDRVSLTSNKFVLINESFTQFNFSHFEYKHRVDTTSDISSFCLSTEGNSKIEFQNDTVCYVQFALDDIYLSYNCSGKRDIIISPKRFITFTEDELGYLVFFIKNEQLYFMTVTSFRNSPNPDIQHLKDLLS